MFKMHQSIGAQMSTDKEQAPSGVKHDQDKPLMALIPPEALLEEARVWTFGAKKYGNWNWTKGLVYTRVLSATFRHLNSIIMGQDVDKESGCLHAACIRANMGMLISFHVWKRDDLDDRLKL